MNNSDCHLDEGLYINGLPSDSLIVERAELHALLSLDTQPQGFAVSFRRRHATALAPYRRVARGALRSERLQTSTDQPSDRAKVSHQRVTTRWTARNQPLAAATGSWQRNRRLRPQPAAATCGWHHAAAITNHSDKQHSCGLRADNAATPLRTFDARSQSTTIANIIGSRAQDCRRESTKVGK